jgi:hypothetical protein
MNRVILPALVALAFACSSEDHDLKPAVGSDLHAEATVTLPSCHGTVGVVGQAVRIPVRASWVTTSCMCKYTTRADGCAFDGPLRCENEDEMGGDPNPQECTTLATEAVAITGVDANGYTGAHCSFQTETTGDAQVVNVLVNCTTPTFTTVTFNVHTEHGDTTVYRDVSFTDDGACLADAADGDDDGSADAADGDDDGSADASDADAAL